MSKLCLTRYVNQSVAIGKDVIVTVREIKNGAIRLQIEAPREIAVDRLEVRERKDQEDGFEPGELR